MGLFNKIKKSFGKSLGELFSGGVLDDEFYDSLEETLILSDMGCSASLEAVEDLRARCKKEGKKTTEQAKDLLRDVLAELLERAGSREMSLQSRPSVVLVIGVNGAGKTTTIGKLALRLKQEGKRVLLCAGDTFRAAAADQLEIWARRAGAEIVRQHEGADPASVLFDAIQSAKARGSDVILCDTAGRLQNKQNLMNELSKMDRILDRELPGVSRETLLVMDAVTGQNGLSQVKEFDKSAGLTGLVLTKLDGTAKGGIVIAVAQELGVPVKWVGLGEKPEDLRPFDPREFVNEII
ncbi:MAG: signal recognition particle-docking protein FtsY [Oscillospiraceae bacterium]|nr:signal recognition particle-docking protein FtsY [Oscillospiraceae bacterium]